MNREKEKLYRKENKVSLSTKYYVCNGEEYRHTRHTKRHRGNFEPMKSGKYGYDYTPLFRFLLSKIGQKWNDVYSEAKSRLDKEEPIWYMVSLEKVEDTSDFQPGYFRYGEHSYWSKLFVDDEGILRKLNESPPALKLSCTCCTHSFNGKPYKK